MLVGISTLDSHLLGELVKVYNNTGGYEKAVSVLERVAEDERDALWYYRYAYSHSELANESNYDFETEAKNALEKLEKAIKISNDEETIRWCLELVEDIKSLEENPSFDIVEPMWGTISIYDGYQKYLQSAQTFTLEQRYLLAITWYFAEVNNGGHHQFLYNSTGIVWEDALNGFKHFGMN